MSQLFKLVPYPSRDGRRNGYRSYSFGPYNASISHRCDRLWHYRIWGRPGSKTISRGATKTLRDAVFALSIQLSRMATGLRVLSLLILAAITSLHAGGPGAVEERWAGVVDGCELVERDLDNCRAALTKRVPCDSCCVDDDSTGADNVRGVESHESPRPAGSQPGAPDSNGPTKGAPQTVTSTRPASRTGDSLGGESAPDSSGGEKWASGSGSKLSEQPASSSPATSRAGRSTPHEPGASNSWHPAAGLSLLNAAYLAHLGAEHRGPRVHWLLLGTLGRMHSDGESVGVFAPKHPNDYGCEYGCNDYAPSGSRTAGGGADTLYGATGIISW